MTELDGVNTRVPPSGAGCVDCDAASPQGWWFHLRRCAECGRIGCCDSSPSQHARAHSKATGHRVIQSFEDDEDWFYDFETGAMFLGPDLTPPTAHPDDQPTPGPSGRVPADWRLKLHA